MLLDSISAPLQVSHLNLNDGTVEGLRLLRLPAFCVQYHPEAGPGPHDSRYLFREFAALMDGVGRSGAHGKVRQCSPAYRSGATARVSVQAAGTTCVSALTFDPQFWP